MSTEPEAVFILASGGAVGAFPRVVDDKPLNFEYQPDRQVFDDREMPGE